MEFLTIEDYKKFIGSKKPDIDETTKQYILSANAAITAYLNYPTNTSETISVYRNRTVYFLENPLITQITSIIRVGDPIYGPSEPVSPTSYFLQDSGKLVFTSSLPDGYYIINYNESDFTVTEDLKLAAFMLVQYWEKAEYRDSKSFGGETVGFTTQSTGMPKHIRTILELYRNL